MQQHTPPHNTHSQTNTHAPKTHTHARRIAMMCLLWVKATMRARNLRQLTLANNSHSQNKTHTQTTHTRARRIAMMRFLWAKATIVSSQFASKFRLDEQDQVDASPHHTCDLSMTHDLPITLHSGGGRGGHAASRRDCEDAGDIHTHTYIHRLSLRLSLSRSLARTHTHTPRRTQSSRCDMTHCCMRQMPRKAPVLESVCRCVCRVLLSRTQQETARECESHTARECVCGVLLSRTPTRPHTHSHTHSLTHAPLYIRDVTYPYM